MTAALMAAILAGAATWFVGGTVASPTIGRPGAGSMDLGSLVDAFIERAKRRRARPDIAELLSAFAGELAAGQPINAALVSSTAGMNPSPCPLAVRAANAGGDVPAALRIDAQAPGCADLRALAACWEVASASGSGLCGAVGRLAATSRAANAARGELRAEMAATRATGRLLVALPMLGIATGIWIGADPVEWFLGSAMGRVVLVVGLGLQLIAAAWLRRITSRAAAGL